MTQYDQIAEQYKESKQLEQYRITLHTMSHWLGDITGRSVLDLACGEGHSSRAVKQMGAGRVVGVDISEQMIRLAREEETRQPLGIEYIVRSVQDLGRIGEFDVVTATYLLNYAQDKEALYGMARTAYQNLRPGCRFLTINDNCGRGVGWPPEESEQYGVRWSASVNPLKDGDSMMVTLLFGSEEVTLTAQYFSRETYERALKGAGFRAVHWHDLLLPPDMEPDGGREFWAPYLERKSIALIECLT
jgi:ubiquinone/menaquinone biosynthesis C-methylase UbiE